MPLAVPFQPAVGRAASPGPPFDTHAEGAVDLVRRVVQLDSADQVPRGQAVGPHPVEAGEDHLHDALPVDVEPALRLVQILYQHAQGELLIGLMVDREVIGALRRGPALDGQAVHGGVGGVAHPAQVDADAGVLRYLEPVGEPVPVLLPVDVGIVAAEVQQHHSGIAQPERAGVVPGLDVGEVVVETDLVAPPESVHVGDASLCQPRQRGRIPVGGARVVGKPDEGTAHGGGPGAWLGGHRRQCGGGKYGHETDDDEAAGYVHIPLPLERSGTVRSATVWSRRNPARCAYTPGEGATPLSLRDRPRGVPAGRRRWKRAELLAQSGPLVTGDAVGVAQKGDPMPRPQPNFDRFLKVVLRQGEPDRVPFAELFHDHEVMVALQGPPAADDPDTLAAWRVKFWQDLGYDYVDQEVDLGFTRGALEAADTADLSRGERGWVNESTGPITTWQEFETYPWPVVTRPPSAAWRRLGAISRTG